MKPHMPCALLPSFGEGVRPLNGTLLTTIPLDPLLLWLRRMAEQTEPQQHVP